MAFGQQSGPPATARQVRQLTALVQAAGHTDFRDARGPLGLTQRQAGGKFSRDEADELIARLDADADADADRAERAERPAVPVVDRRDAERARVLRRMPTEALAAELQQRGWIVVEP